MTRALTFAVSLIAAGQTEVDSANYMMPGCRPLVQILNNTAPRDVSYFAAGNCGGRIEGLLTLRDDLLPESRFCRPPVRDHRSSYSDGCKLARSQSGPLA
jgi:hypothetical protein